MPSKNLNVLADLMAPPIPLHDQARVFVVSWPDDATPTLLRESGWCLARALGEQLPPAAVLGLHEALAARLAAREIPRPSTRTRRALQWLAAAAAAILVALLTILCPFFVRRRRFP